MFALTKADLPMSQGEAARPLDVVLKELEEFIGMRSVKDSIRRLAVQSMFMKQRAAAGAGNVQQMAMNFILTGNPGTGKTSIARKMGEILQAMDLAMACWWLRSLFQMRFVQCIAFESSVRSSSHTAVSSTTPPAAAVRFDTDSLGV